MEFVDEAKVINEYGATVPDEYGGVRGEEWIKFVAMFTGNLEHHLAELRARLPFPENVRVVRCTRLWRDVEHANQALQRRLLLDNRHPGVSMVGIGMNDGEFVVTVGIHPYDDATIRSVEEAAAPYEVVVLRQGPVRLLDATRRESDA